MPFWQVALIAISWAVSLVYILTREQSLPHD